MAAAYKSVKNCIHDFNQWVFALAFVGVKKILNRVPLVVGDVGWIICHNHVKFGISLQNYEEKSIQLTGSQIITNKVINSFACFQ